MKRRPHRSFVLTRRRDYKRSLKLPGYLSLTKQVFDIFIKNKKIFLGLIFIYAIAGILLTSLVSQESYAQLKESVEELSQGETLGNVLPTIALFWGVLTSQMSGTALTETGSSQQLMAGIITLFAWLTTIWLLRQIMLGRKPRIRDGLYSAGSPVIALAVLSFVMILQLIPSAVALIAYSAADASGLFDQTAILMLFAGGALLLVILSVYWVTSTIIAMVIVTIPGMYPMRALKLAGDLVVGRRIRILLRLSWLAVILILIWAVFLIPTILLDGALKSAIPALDWFPLVPLAGLLLMAFSVVFLAIYVFVFYRKVIEDDSAPA